MSKQIRNYQQVRDTLNRTEGELSATSATLTKTMQELAESFGCSTVEEAQEKINKLQRTLKTIHGKLTDAIDQLNSRLQGLGKEDQ